MSKITSLTVHKNTRIKRRNRDMRERLFHECKSFTSSAGDIGYVLIKFNDKGESNTCYDVSRLPNIIPELLPHICIEAVKSAVTLSDLDE